MSGILSLSIILDFFCVYIMLLLVYNNVRLYKLNLDSMSTRILFAVTLLAIVDAAWSLSTILLPYVLLMDILSILETILVPYLISCITYFILDRVGLKIKNPLTAFSIFCLPVVCMAILSIFTLWTPIFWKTTIVDGKVNFTYLPSYNLIYVINVPMLLLPYPGVIYRLLYTKDDPVKLQYKANAKFCLINGLILGVSYIILSMVSTIEEICTALPASAACLYLITYTSTNDMLQTQIEITKNEADLNTAAKIQSSMLSTDFPNEKEYTIFASMDPAKEVGGDFYDFYKIDDNHLALTIADVSGKGVPASLFMAISKSLLKHCVETKLSPELVLEQVNNQLANKNDGGMFVTVWLGILDIDTGALTCANAGHEYPIIYRRENGFNLEKEPHGLALGVLPNSKYKKYQLQLQKGDSLFVYTDGVTEATDSHNKLFGDENLVKTLNKYTGQSPSVLVSKVKSSIDEFVGEAPQFDDITMLCLAYKAF